MLGQANAVKGQVMERGLRGKFFMALFVIAAALGQPATASVTVILDPGPPQTPFFAGVVRTLPFEFCMEPCPPPVAPTYRTLFSTGFTNVFGDSKLPPPGQELLNVVEPLAPDGQLPIFDDLFWPYRLGSDLQGRYRATLSIFGDLGPSDDVHLTIANATEVVAERDDSGLLDFDAQFGLPYYAVAYGTTTDSVLYGLVIEPLAAPLPPALGMLISAFALIGPLLLRRRSASHTGTV